MMRLITLLFFLSQALWIATVHAAEASANDAYAQAVRIEQEIGLIKRHYKVSGKIDFTPLRNIEMKPEHVWSRAYVILLKLGKFRRGHGLPYVEPISIEPVLDMPPNPVWAMTQRIFNEIEILKFFLDIPGQMPAVVRVSGKKPLDVYNKLTQVSLELDLINGATSPSEVYSEAKRINEDVNQVLRQLRIFEAAVPPPRRSNLQPKDSLYAVFAVLAEIQRIQRGYGLKPVDFKAFDKGDKTVPDEVLMMVELTLTEFQRIKFHLGMTHAITPPSTYAEDKKPDDVVQLLGYITDKLQEIKVKE